MTMLGQEKPSLDDLSHHGVKGMKWGVRRDARTGVRPIARTLNDSKFGQKSISRAEAHMRKQTEKAVLKSVRLSNASKVERARQEATNSRPSNHEILTARSNIHQHNANVSRARANYKVAKAQYKIDKQTMGKTKAKTILEKNGKLGLQKAHARRNANYDIASKETSGEVVNRIIKNFLGTP